MNIEIDQQQKFIKQFSKLADRAPQKFKEKWDHEIKFKDDTTHRKLLPCFNAGAIHLLPTGLKEKFIILRDKYFAKAL